MLRLKPTAHNELLLRVESHRVLTMCVQIAEERAFPPCEWEESHWRRHSYIHPDHPDLAPRRVFARRLPALRKDRCGISEGRVIHQVDRLVQRLHPHYRQHRPEDLFLRD